MRYLSDLKSLSLGELIELERDWRETAERQIETLVDEAYFPGAVGNSSTDVIKGCVADIALLAKNVEADIDEWGRVAMALINARAKMDKDKRKWAE